MKKSKSGGRPRDVRLPPGIVEHPRFGAEPQRSDASIPEAQASTGHWRRFEAATMFPETAIPADPARQHYAVYPRRFYIDQLRTCWDCARPFLFFAREQRYWFETLRFFVDADAVRCTDCRRARHATAAALRRYSAAMTQASLSDDALLAAVEDAAALAEAGVLRRLERLGALKNRALRQLGERAAIERLEQQITRLREDKEAT